MNKQKTCSDADLELAVYLIGKKELSYRQAESKFAIPRSTLHDHVAGKALTTKRGPPTLLNLAEESMLVDWALHMADIGYGRTREELCLMVKKIDGRDNPFSNNMPGE